MGNRLSHVSDGHRTSVKKSVKKPKLNGHDRSEVKHASRRIWSLDQRRLVAQAYVILSHTDPDQPEAQRIMVAQTVIPKELRRPQLNYPGQVGPWFIDLVRKEEANVLMLLELHKRAKEISERLNFDFLKPISGSVDDSAISKVLEFVVTQHKAMLESLQSHLRKSEEAVGQVLSQIHTELDRTRVNMAAVLTAIREVNSTMSQVLENYTDPTRATAVTGSATIDSQSLIHHDKPRKKRIVFIGFHGKQCGEVSQRYQDKFDFTFVPPDKKQRVMNQLPHSVDMVYCHANLGHLLGDLRDRYTGKLEVLHGSSLSEMCRVLELML